MAQDIVYLGKCPVDTWGKKVYSALLGWSVV